MLAAAAASGDERPALFHTPPPQAQLGDPLVVEGLLVNGARVTRVVLHYRGPAEPYSSVRMERQYGDLFHGEIPGPRVVAPGVEYYVDGSTTEGRTVPLFMTEAHPARVLVVQNVVKPRPPVEPRPPVPDARSADRERGSGQHSGSTKGGSAGEAASDEAPPPVTDRDVERPGSTRDSSSVKPERPRTELDEELSLYSAEDRAAVVSHELRQPVSPELTTVLTREQIRATGARSVMEALSLMPGITVTRDMSGFYNVGVRGLRQAPEVLFLLDGHVLNNPYDGRALANLPVENLARIELTRGPGPADLGEHAFLAVINLVTLHPEGMAAAVSGGTGTTFDGHLTAGRALGGDWKVFGDADALYQQGERHPVQQDSLAQHTLAQHYREDASAPAGQTEDWRLLVNAGAGVRYGHEGGSTLTAQLRVQHEQRSALIGLFDSLGNGSHLTWTALLGDVTYALPLGGGSQLSFRLFADDHATDRRYVLTPGKTDTISGFSTAPDDTTSDPTLVFPEGVQEAYRTEVRRIGLDARSDIQIADSNRLTAGVWAQDELVAQDQHLTNYDDADGLLRHLPGLQDNVYGDMLQQLDKLGMRSRLSAAVYAMDRWALLPELTLDVGLRAEVFQLPRPSDASSTGGDQVQMVPYVSPHVAVAYAPASPLVIKLQYARAVRPPTVSELTELVRSNELNHGRFSGNLGLRPPVEDDVELFADLVQVAGESRVHLRGGFFYQSFADAIAAVDLSGDVTPLSNRLGVRSLGAEAEARMDISRRANVWLNASFFRDWDLETALPNYWLLTDLPQGRLNLGVSMPIGEWLDVDLTLETGTERRNDARSALEVLRRYRIPAYHLISAQVRTERLFDAFELALVVRNLFQQDLVDDPFRPDRVTGLVPREGLSAFLTVRMSL